ncbi:MAG: hypothetical protein ACRDT6_00005 [Micromonosporaceae bacterium]
MTTYAAAIGEDHIEFLCDTAGTLGCAGVLDHVAAKADQPDADTMVFDGTEDVPSPVELRWRPECDHQAAVTL